MKTIGHALIFVCVLLSAGLHAQEPPPPPKEDLPPTKTSCFTCHLELDPEGAVSTIQEDVHFQLDLGCHDCHGGNPKAGFDGDPDAAHDESMGYRLAPQRTEIPEFCARCHSDPDFMKKFDPHARVDQLREYRTSKHGLAVLQRGQDEAAVCVDCHGVHGILRVNDTRSPVHPTHVAETCAHCHANADLMEQFDLSIKPYGEYKQSVHYNAIHSKGDISAPTCNDCHGNHGAVPPGVEVVANVCGTCHTREATLFRETEKKFDLNLTLCIRCVICHSNHAVQHPTDDMLGVGPKSTCTACHAPGDKSYDSSRKMKEGLEELKEAMDAAREILHDAERAGMLVSEDLYNLQEAEDKLVELRVLAHSFDRDRYLTEAGEGTQIAKAGIAAGERAFAELHFRRKGLAASLIIILVVIVALVLKIRSLESEGGSEPL